MLQNSSSFVAYMDQEEIKNERRLLVSRNYEDIKFMNRQLRPCGEVEIVKDFHIEITSNGETSILEYSRGEVLDVVKSVFRKYIHLGFSPSGFYIVSEPNEDFFKVIS